MPRAVCLVVLLVPCAHLIAQRQGGAPHIPDPLENLAPVAGNAMRGVDTSMVVGRHDFARYTLPAYCLAAARSVQSVAMRAELDNTARYAPAHDTLVTTAVAMAQRCLGRYAVETVSIVQLPNLLALALAAGNDVQSNAAAARYLTAARMLDQRAKTTFDVDLAQALFVVDSVYYHAHPMRLASVETTTARLDMLGRTAAFQRGRAHSLLFTDAEQRFDVSRAEREATAMWVLDTLYSASDRENHEFQAGANEAGWLFAMYLASMPVEAAMTRVEQLLKQSGHQHPDMLRQIARRVPQIARSVIAIGKPLPPLTATYWFGSDGRPIAVPRWPVPGKVSLFYVNNNKGQYPARDAMVRRLHEKYGDRLDITYMLRTEGSFRGGPPLTAEEEAERIRKYLQVERNLPVAVAVDASPVRRLPDGRVYHDPAPFERRADVYRLGFVVADPTGKALYIYMDVSEQQLDTMISHALGRPES